MSRSLGPSRRGAAGRRLAVVAVALVAGWTGWGCGSEGAAVRPPEIDYGADMCDLCSMIISDPRFAAASLVETADGERSHRRFDDVAGMVRYHRARPELAVVTSWVHDFEEGDWIRADSARYVRSQQLPTPMASGVVAVRTMNRARVLARRFEGEVLDYGELRRRVGAAEGEGP